MGRTVEATIEWVQLGRRRHVHRQVTVEGVGQLGTERCNTDDATYPPRIISEDEFEQALQEQRVCRWCNPAPADDPVSDG